MREITKSILSVRNVVHRNEKRKERKIPIWSLHIHVYRAKQVKFLWFIFCDGKILREKIENPQSRFIILTIDPFCCLSHVKQDFSFEKQKKNRVDKILQLDEKKIKMSQNLFFYFLNLDRYQHLFNTALRDLTPRQRHRSEHFAPSVEWDRLLIW